VHFIYVQFLKDGGYSFIFTCKEESRRYLTETVKNSYLKEHKRRGWNGREDLEYRYQRLNGVEIREDTMEDRE
jgi:hypothetical protein